MSGYYKGMGANGRFHQYAEMGWAPVPWSHHPKEIRDALRATGLRPGLKMCFANSQRLLVRATDMGLAVAERLAYREGWALLDIGGDSARLPIEHGWLEYGGNVLDLTSADGRLQYGPAITYSYEQIVKNAARTGLWCVLDPRALAEIHPMRKAFESINKSEPKA